VGDFAPTGIGPAKDIACPFCGSISWKVWERGVGYNARVRYADRRFRVQCNKCNSRGPSTKTEELAILSWNSRIIPG